MSLLSFTQNITCIVTASTFVRNGRSGKLSRYSRRLCSRNIQRLSQVRASCHNSLAKQGQMPTNPITSWLTFVTNIVHATHSSSVLSIRKTGSRTRKTRIKYYQQCSRFLMCINFHKTVLQYTRFCFGTAISYISP